jgi:hypothetical protein
MPQLADDGYGEIVARLRRRAASTIAPRTIVIGSTP